MLLCNKPEHSLDSRPPTECVAWYTLHAHLHTKFHIQIVNKRKMYTEEKYVRPIYGKNNVAFEVE